MAVGARFEDELAWYFMNCGKVMDTRSTFLVIPSVLVLFLGTLCASKARAQISPGTAAGSPIVTVNFVTTTPTPLNPGFNGFNSNLLNAVEYYDTWIMHRNHPSERWPRSAGDTSCVSNSV